GVLSMSSTSTAGAALRAPPLSRNRVPVSRPPASLAGQQTCGAPRLADGARSVPDGLPGAPAEPGRGRPATGGHRLPGAGADGVLGRVLSDHSDSDRRRLDRPRGPGEIPKTRPPRGGRAGCALPPR